MTKSTAQSAPTPGVTMSFEAIVERLEHIAGHLETGDAKLEEALALFEEGVALSKQGSHKLDAAERKLERLLESGATEVIAESHIAPSGEGF